MVLWLSSLFSLVVGVTAAHVHHITRSHVYAGLKQISLLFYENKTLYLQSTELWASPRRGSSPGSHWPSPPPGCSSPGTWGNSFVDVRWQSWTNLGDTLHGTGTPDKRFALRLGPSVRSIVVVVVVVDLWSPCWLLLRTRLLLRLQQYEQL